MPYAPVHVTGSRNPSGDLAVAWVRRTRLGGAWRDGTGTVPLGEASEAYEVDILDGPGGSVLRTITRPHQPSRHLHRRSADRRPRRTPGHRPPPRRPALGRRRPLFCQYEPLGDIQRVDLWQEDGFERLVRAIEKVLDPRNQAPRLRRPVSMRVRAPHFLATQYLRTNGIKSQFPNGIVSSVSFVSTTNTARSLAGCVSLALALTPRRSPGSSEKLCPAL